MKPFLKIILCLYLFSAAIISAAENKAEQNWDECAVRVINNIPAELGIAAGVAAISESCGVRPIVTTANGARLFRSDCDWLYKQPLRECAEYESKNKCDVAGDSNYLPFDLISMSSYRGMFDLSEEIFSRAKFTELCRNSCKSGVIPSREQFGREFCGE